MKKTTLIALLLLCLTLAGCGGNSGSAGQEPADSQTAAPAETPEPEKTPAPEKVPAAEPAEGEKTATLYIGTRAEGFAEYPMPYGGELEPDALIEGIGRLTGWDMSLEEPVITGKGGMSVCFSENCALFVGPPEEQKEEFHMFGADQLAETLLDSVQKTLQENYTLEGGDPDALDIWYFLKGDQPLSIPSLGLSWAIDQPCQWTAAVAEE